MGEWVGELYAGTEGRGEGEAGRAEVVHVGRAHRESNLNLSTLRSAKEDVARILRLHRRLRRVTDEVLNHQQHLLSAESIVKR